jgi:hypothetical protein
VLAFALHVVDEALNDFLPLYNSVVGGWREASPWVPLPVFTFSGWLTLLIVALIVLASLTPLFFAGSRSVRPIAWFFGALMVANAFGHFGMSIYMGAFAPGVYSSPVVLIAALVLLKATRQAHRFE